MQCVRTSKRHRIESALAWRLLGAAGRHVVTSLLAQLNSMRACQTPCGRLLMVPHQDLPMMTTLFRMVTILMITFVTCCPMRECIGRCASRLRLVAQPHRTTSRRPGTRPSLCHHPTQTHRAQVCTCACDVAHRRRETERQSSYVDLSGHSTYRQLH
jgi:hypothetical protein